MTITDQQLIADLKAAKKEIEIRGWCRCNLLNPAFGSVCAVGALAVMQKAGLTAQEFWEDVGLWIATDRVKAGIVALAEYVPPCDRDGNEYVDSRSMVEGYNDSHTMEDVLDLYDKAIANLGGAVAPVP